MKKPNIIFFFSDQQRWDTVGAYDKELGVTPNLDRMAKEGVRFEYAFTCQPVCGPARACLQTGKYPTETGCFANNIKLPQSEKTVADILSGGGYDTAYIGKWHLASSGPEGGEEDYTIRAVPPERRGGYTGFWLASDVLEFTSRGYGGHMFDGDMNKWEFPKGRYRADVLTDRALEYIKNRNSGNPFFLFLSFIEPHHQNDQNCYEGPEGSKEKFRDYKVPGDLKETAGDWRENFPDYLGCVNSLDYNLGRIREELKKQNIDQNTIIIYTSDHGSHFKTRNSEYKRCCHDACTRIPLIIYGPGFSSGRMIDNLVSLIDLPPAILNMAGICPPEYMSGRPVQELIRGDAEDWPEEVFIQISESQVGRAVRTHRWKYSVCAPDRDPVKYSSSKVYVEDFLYDLKNDPHERFNLVTDPVYSEIRKKMSGILKRKMIEAGEKIPDIVPKT